MWFIRQWARETQDTLNRHSLFIRSTWEDAMVRNLNLVAIADMDLSDSSFFLQPFAEYHFSNHLTFSLT
ncbi:MAG: hypothetical protein HC887_01460, partial [Desulfobacteraceae bacterium]|nr:hypothetical protein [Desulfobacteraceae bacterium]